MPRTVAITLVDKRRVQPETLEKIQKVLDSGADHGIIAVDRSELEAFVSFNVTSFDADALSTNEGKANGKHAAKPAPDDRVRKALEQQR